MKCKDCNSCLRIIRIDKEPQSRIYFYCTLCTQVFNFYGNRSLVEDSEIRKEVEDKYKELNGDIV